LDFAEKAGAKLIKPAQEADWEVILDIFQILMVFYGKLLTVLLLTLKNKALTLDY